MYLEALITKWRHQHLKFEVETKPLAQLFELTVMILDSGRYISLKCMSLEEGCGVLDSKLTQVFGGAGDKHKPDSREE